MDEIPCAPQVEQQQLAYPQVDRYFSEFQALKKAENWNRIVVLGEAAVTEAEKSGRTADEALIHAQLASTHFYKGNFLEAIEHSNSCCKLAGLTANSNLLVRGLYLQSAAYRALAGVAEGSDQAVLFASAIDVGQVALRELRARNLIDANLEGKVFFNLGAANADNPEGNWTQAVRYYEAAIALFSLTDNDEEIVRTSIRLAKTKLLLGKPAAAQTLLDTVRTRVKTDRSRMHVEFLEAQIALASRRPKDAITMANRALERARRLGAREDEFRLLNLVHTAESSK